MALSDIDIASRSLTRIGADTITSFDDGSRESEIMKQLYSHVYETILTEARWNFATKDIELSLDVTTPTDKTFNNQFLLPADYLNTIHFYLNNGVRTHDYTRQGKFILSNHTRLFAKYTSKPDENDLPPWFVNYLVVRLAFTSVEAVIGISSLQGRLEVETRDARIIAYKQDSAEQPLVDALAPSSYVAVRF